MLTDFGVKNAKPKENPYKPRKMSDGGGLYLLVNAIGKYWRLNYRFAGKQKTLALGVYPGVTLADARGKRKEAKQLLKRDIDPAVAKKTKKYITYSNAMNTFEAVGSEWFEKQRRAWAESTATNIQRYLKKDLFPWLGDRPIKEITAPELLEVLLRIESRGAHEKATRCREYAGRVFRYAIATGRCERDPSYDLKGALAPVVRKHHPSITTPKDIGELLRAINVYKGTFVVKCALQLAPLVFIRPGELRQAEWREIDFSRAEMRIIAHRMKKRITHIVPLSRQALEILESIQPLTGKGEYIFPCIRSSSRTMSENTVNAALRRMGYSKDVMCGHGFRGTASTLLHEHGWPHEAIERQLSHGERNKVVAAYNHAQHMSKRREMMQWWADYLDGLANEF